MNTIAIITLITCNHDKFLNSGHIFDVNINDEY